MKTGDRVASRETGATGKVLRLYEPLRNKDDRYVLVGWHGTENASGVPIADKVRESTLRLVDG